MSRPISSGRRAEPCATRSIFSRDARAPSRTERATAPRPSPTSRRIPPTRRSTSGSPSAFPSPLDHPPHEPGVATMQSSPATFSDPVHDLRYRIADLLANIEAENDGLDARTATLALLETAYRAALTFCATPDRARRHVGDAVDNIHAGALIRRTRKTAGDSTSPPRDRRGTPRL